jgi:predicted RecA/RadA family phage recombinase
MKNFVQNGHNLDFIAPAGGVVSGVAIVIGALIVVPATTAAEGMPFAGWIEGVYNLPAAVHASTQAWTTGQLLYWDDAAKVFTITVGSNKKAGVAAAPKASADATGAVKLIQTL